MNTLYMYYAGYSFPFALIGWIGILGIFSALKKVGISEKLSKLNLYLLLWSITVLLFLILGESTAKIVVKYYFLTWVFAILTHIVSIVVVKKRKGGSD